MTSRQKKFAYIMAKENIKPGDAAIKAGYSPKFAAQNADKLIKNHKIVELIKELQEPHKKKALLDARRRKEILQELAENSENLPGDRMKAIDILNKMDGTYLKADKIKEREIRLKEAEFELKKKQSESENW